MEKFLMTKKKNLQGLLFIWQFLISNLHDFSSERVLEDWLNKKIPRKKCLLAFKFKLKKLGFFTMVFET